MAKQFKEEDPAPQYFILDNSGLKSYSICMDVIKLDSASLNCFLKGISSVFCLSGTSFMEIPDLETGFARDREAIQKDWLRIGDDMRRAMAQVACER